jgi:hypothetical protein
MQKPERSGGDVRLICDDAGIANGVACSFCNRQRQSRRPIEHDVRFGVKRHHLVFVQQPLMRDDDSRRIDPTCGRR